MTALISIRLQEELIHDMRMMAEHLELSQTEYIRQAIEEMNRKMLKEQRKKRLKKASLLTRQDSTQVNKEFSDIEHDPEV